MTHEEKVADWLHRVQVRELRKDTGHGYVTTRQVALQFGMARASAAVMLERMAAAGKAVEVPFSNCLCWRSANPLPWEPGGSWPPGCVVARPPEPDSAAAILRDLAALEVNVPGSVRALITRARALS